jgi:hypothetical protein
VYPKPARKGKKPERKTAGVCIPNKPEKKQPENKNG